MGNDLLSRLTAFLPTTALDWATAIITLVVLVAFFAVGWRNRAIEPIRSRFWSAIGLGIVGSLLAARALSESQSASEVFFGAILPAVSLFATGALVTIILSLKAENRQVEFPAVFIYDQKSKEPLETLDANYFSGRTGITLWQYFPKRMVQDKPSYLESMGDELYLDLLLRMVLELLFTRYRSHWAVRSSRLEIPHARGTTHSWGPQEDAPSSEFFEWKECDRWFPDTPVFHGPAIFGEPQLAVPLGTKITGRTEYSGDKDIYRRSLSFANSFLDLSISILHTGGMVGIGDLRKLLGYSDEHCEKFFVSTYEVTLRANYKRLRSGDPRMPRIRSWVEDMFEELQTEFDVRRQWVRQREHYTTFR